MKVIYIECDAEEMRANRTILDNMSEFFSTITRAVAGVDVTPDALAAAMSEDDEGEEEE